MLDIYTDFLICSTSYTTATALSRATGNAISHDNVTRFLSVGRLYAISFMGVCKTTDQVNSK